MTSQPLGPIAATLPPAFVTEGTRRDHPFASHRSPFGAELQRHVLLGMVREALESGQPDSALVLLDQVWSAELSREDCWYLRGQALYLLRRYAEAGQVAGQGLARLPRSAALYFLLGNCELRLRNAPDAERAIRDALALLPEHPVLLCRYADLLRRADRPEAAREILARAEAAAPGHPLIARERRAGEVRPAEADHYGETALGLSLLEGVVLPAPRSAAPGWRIGGPATAVLAVGAAAALLAAAGYRVSALVVLGAALVLAAKISRR